MLRKLKEKDIPYMLEWMHDREIISGFQTPFDEYTEAEAKSFIENSFSGENQHFAFTDENDEYLGTISLKNISYKNMRAEYAIVARKKAQGTGAARKATEELLNYAFDELKLHKVYLSVLEKNYRARSFYEKCGFKYEGTDVDAVLIDGEYQTHIWYGLIQGAVKE